jgi:DNA polymerase/3'-5' exonuclease PolX
MSTKIKNKFRLKHVKYALSVIQKHPTKIKNGKELESKPGIGKGTVDRINEILKNGKLGEIQTHQSDKYLSYVGELEKVYGIGREKAIDLIKNHEITTVKQLKSAIKNNKLNVPDNIKIGLKYHGVYETGMPRVEIDKYNIEIQKNIDKQTTAVICGSYRRQKLTSNDIDVLLVDPSVQTKNKIKKSKILSKFIQKFIKKKIIIDGLTDVDVETKFMGFCQLPNHPVRRIDIRFMPYESFYSALLYFTGSGSFNKKMRHVAINAGYLLNEYGLFDRETKKQIKITSEKDIFDVLGMEYLEPHLRT